MVPITAEALGDYQSLLEFRKSKGAEFTPNQVLSLSEQLARLQAYEEVPGQDLGVIIEDARKEIYGSYPFKGIRRDWADMRYISHNGEDVLEAIIKQWSAFRQRFLAALFGGYILLIPMLIMTLNPRLITALLTTTVCVLGVVLFIAIQYHEAEPKDLLTIAAAYAAVLVVFVGTSTTTETMKPGVVALIVVGVLLVGTAVAVLYVYLLKYRRIRSIRRFLGNARSAR